MALAIVGDADGAIEIYSQLAVAKNPGKLNVWHIWINHLAWLLAIRPDPQRRYCTVAVDLAQTGRRVRPPRMAIVWRTLGVAHYRAGDWQAQPSSRWRRRSSCRQAPTAFDLFFLAMAHWQLGDKDEARKFYDQAAEWIDSNKAGDVVLRYLQDEAAELMGIKVGARKWFDQGMEWIKKKSPTMKGIAQTIH